MPRIIDTAQLSPSSAGKKKDSPLFLENHQVYCGLDSCVTLEVDEKINPQLDVVTREIYNFSRALQAPVLEMMARGILTDYYEVQQLIDVYEKRRQRIFSILQRFSMVIWGSPLNPASPKQLMEFFYGAMNIPKIYIFDKGVRKLSVNREVLIQIQQYRYARPIATAVLAHRDLAKKIAVLKSGIDDDERMRFSFNVGGTNSGRFSCNKNVFGGGTNGNNISDELRRIFIADKGKKFAYLDLEQAESYCTAYLAGDEAYIDACTSGDLHTSVAKLIWPEIFRDPTNRSDREIAEDKFWRHWSYRDLAKRGGHLLNYCGTPAANAKNLNISRVLMTQFSNTYMNAFPGIRRMHGDVARILQTEASITTPLGRVRLFFGRNYEDEILRKAVAYGPQSTISDLLNLGMWRIWKHVKEVQLLTQLYDAVLIQYEDDPEVEARVISRCIELMTIPIMVTDLKLKGAQTREMTVPVDAVVGWNWGKFDKKNPDVNPDGLMPYTGPDKRSRQISPETDLLKRLM